MLPRARLGSSADQCTVTFAASFATGKAAREGRGKKIPYMHMDVFVNKETIYRLGNGMKQETRGNPQLQTRNTSARTF
jgi:hypothetical protein